MNELNLLVICEGGTWPTRNREYEVRTSLELVVADVIRIYYKSSLLQEFSLGTLKVSLVTLTMTLWEGPLLADPSSHKKDFTVIVDQNGAIYLHMAGLVTLEGVWHGASLSGPEHLRL